MTWSRSPVLNRTTLIFRTPFPEAMSELLPSVYIVSAARTPIGKCGFGQKVMLSLCNFFSLVGASGQWGVATRLTSVPIHCVHIDKKLRKSRCPKLFYLHSNVQTDLHLSFSISNSYSGSFNGCFSKVHPAELGGTAIKEVLARANVKGEDVCEVIMGNVGQVYSKTFSTVFLSSLSFYLSPGTASWFETEPGTPSLLQRGHPTGRACFRPEHVVWLWSKVHSTRLPGDSQWRGKDRGERRTGEHDQSASYDPVA